MYKVLSTPRFDKEFSKLDRYTQRMIRSWMVKHIMNCADPRAYGKALRGDRKDQWRYRIGCYRLICEIRDAELIILALAIRRRKEVYN